MFFYVNSTLALFGDHHENEALGAVNFMLGVPGWDDLAVKLWFSGNPQIIQGTPSYMAHLVKADETVGGMYKACILCKFWSLPNLFFFEIASSGEALHRGSCFFDPKVHQEFRVTVQNIGDVIYTAPGAGHEGIGIVSALFFLGVFHNLLMPAGRCELCLECGAGQGMAGGI